MSNEIEKIKFTLRPDRIIEIECAPNTVMSLAEGLYSTKIVGQLTNSTPLPLLCDLTNVVRMSRECRVHFASKEHAAVFACCALIIQSPISKVIGNFFLSANKPVRPVKLFTSRVKGLTWLKNMS